MKLTGSKTLIAILFVLIWSSCVPVPSTSLKQNESTVSFNSKDPIDNGANPQFFDEFDFDGNDILINWIPFSDDIRIVNHRVILFPTQTAQVAKLITDLQVVN